MKKTISLALILFFAAAWASAFAAQAKAPIWEAIKGPGKRNPIGGKAHFVLKPIGQPKVGTVNLRVQFIDKSGKTGKHVWALKGALSAAGEAVPADSAFKPFSPNKSGIYVLPLTIAKAGKWEFRLIILKDGKVVYRGLSKVSV